MISLSDDQLRQVMDLAGPVPIEQRAEFRGRHPLGARGDRGRMTGPEGYGGRSEIGREPMIDIESIARAASVPARPRRSGARASLLLGFCAMLK